MASSKSQTIVLLPPVVKQYWFWMVVLSVAALGTKLFNRYVLHLPSNYVYPFFPWFLKYVDLRCWIARFQGFHHLSFFGTDPGLAFPFAYPAPVALPYEFFYLLPMPVGSYLLVAMFGTILAALAFVRELRRRGIGSGTALGFVATSVVCSWPIFVCLWIANMEIFVAILVGVGLYLFLTGRGWSAALLFGIATGMKIFPFIFLALFLVKRQFRHMAFFLGIAAVLNLFSLWLISGSIVASWHGIGQGLEYFRVQDVLPFNRLAPGVEHSLFSLLKSLIVLYDSHFGMPYPNVATMSAILRGYMASMAIIGILLYFLRIQFLPILNQIMCLCVVSILFTPLSIDYTLMHLYVPLGMMVLLALKAARTGQRIPGMSAVFGCFAVLLAPLCEFVRHGVLIGALGKCLVLILLLVLALRFPFAEYEEPLLHIPG